MFVGVVKDNSYILSYADKKAASISMSASEKGSPNPVSAVWSAPASQNHYNGLNGHNAATDNASFKDTLSQAVNSGIRTASGNENTLSDSNGDTSKSGDISIHGPVSAGTKSEYRNDNVQLNTSDILKVLGLESFSQRSSSINNDLFLSQSILNETETSDNLSGYGLPESALSEILSAARSGDNPIEALKVSGESVMNTLAADIPVLTNMQILADFQIPMHNGITSVDITSAVADQISAVSAVSAGPKYSEDYEQSRKFSSSDNEDEDDPLAHISALKNSGNRNASVLKKKRAFDAYEKGFESWG